MNIVSDDLRGAKGILEIIRESIETGDEDELREILDSILFNEIKFEDAVELTIGLLNMCTDVDESDLAKIIYDTHELFYPLNTEIEFITYLILHKRTTVRLLSFLLHDVIPNYNLSEIVYQLCFLKEKDSSEMAVAVDKCWQIFEIPNADDLNKLYDYTSKVNVTVGLAISRKLRKENNYAAVPTWMITPKILPRESNVKIPTFENLELNLPSSQMVIDKMISEMDEELKRQISCPDEGSETEAEDIADIRNILLMKYNALSLNDKYEVAKDFVSKRNMLALQYDLHLFIALGPSAPLADSRLEDLTPTVSGGTVISSGPQIDYGGARMFTFNNFDVDPYIEDDETYPDGVPKNLVNWFVGYCQQCYLRIRRKYHAVRVPMIFGGWQGCFCSWKCVRDNIVETENRTSIDIMTRLTNIYEDQINTYKILDRIPDEEYNKYLSELLNNNKELIELNENVEFNAPALETTVTDTNQITEKEAVAIESGIAADDITETDRIQIEDTPIVLHYFYSKTCDICKRLRPQLYQFVEYSSTVSETGNYVKTTSINEIDVDEVDVSSIGVTQVPTVVLMRNGVPIGTFIGANIIRSLSLAIAAGNT